MAKTIMKEIIIGLLLCLAIILVLGIILYEYAPTKKTIPSPVAYSVPEEAQEELSTSSEIDESKIIMTYEVDSADLSDYARVRNYKPGKSNPFSSYETQVDATNITTGKSSNATSGNGSEQSNSSEPQNPSNESSQNGTNESKGFYPDKGTK